MKLAYIFFDINMSNGHKGLTAILNKKLKENEVAIFINKKFTGLKMLMPKGFFLYLKRPPNQPIHPDTIKYLPNCLDGADLNYNKALRSVIIKEFSKKGYLIK